MANSATVTINAKTWTQISTGTFSVQNPSKRYTVLVASAASLPTVNDYLGHRVAPLDPLQQNETGKTWFARILQGNAPDIDLILEEVT